MQKMVNKKCGKRSCRLRPMLPLLSAAIAITLCVKTVPSGGGTFSSWPELNITNVTVVKQAEATSPRETNDYIKLRPGSLLTKLIYDDAYMRSIIAARYPYLSTTNGSDYIALRDYFHFEQVFWPSEQYLASVNIEEYLYNELRAMEVVASQTSMDIWHYSDERELAISGGPKASGTECERNLLRLGRELQLAEENPEHLFGKGRKNIELLRWIDTWGRPVSETYYGNSYWVGSYRGCKYAELDLARVDPDGMATNETISDSRTDAGADKEQQQQGAASEPIRFNYCWAKLAAKDWPETDEMIPRISLRAGICLPDSCDTKQANKLKQTILQMLHFNFSPLHRQRFNRILDIYCLPVRDSMLTSFNKLPLATRLFIQLTTAWLVLILVASLHRRYHQKRQPAVVGASPATPEESLGALCLRSVSIQESMRVYLADDAPPASMRIDLRVLGLPKLVACIMVVVGHTFVQVYWNFHSSSIQLLTSHTVEYHIAAWLWKALEIFFVSSGILTAYLTIHKLAAGAKIHLLLKPQVYIALNVLRYLRLAPVMMFAYSFMKTIFVHLAEGPFWDYGTWALSGQGRCLAISWWRNLIWPIILDVGGKSGDPHQNECLVSSWYIITDLKMFLVVPAYVYLIYTKARHRTSILIGTIALSTVWKYLHLQAQQLVYYDQFFKYGEMHANSILITFLESSYYSPVDRFQSMAIGLTAGYYLYQYKDSKIKRWPTWMGSTSMWLMFAWNVYDFFFRTSLDEINYRQTGYIPSDAYIQARIIVKNRLDAISVAILTLRLTSDWAPQVMRYSLPLYKLSKLSYCVYIVHTLLLTFVISANEKARPDSMMLEFNMLALFIVVASFIIAFPLYILVESPLTLLLLNVINKMQLHKLGPSTTSPLSTSPSSSESSDKKLMKASDRMINELSDGTRQIKDEQKRDLRPTDSGKQKAS